MSKTLQQLHTDHINASRLLTILQQQLIRLVEGEETDFGLMIDIMTYLTQYPDLYHHPKEDLIFEQWQKRDASISSLVDELAVEHKSIIRSGIHLLELLRGVTVDVLQRRNELIETGGRYLAHQREHMSREESELFPQIKRTLHREDWAWIDKQLMAPDDPLFGRAVSERFRERYAQIMRLIKE